MCVDNHMAPPDFMQALIGQGHMVLNSYKKMESLPPFKNEPYDKPGYVVGRSSI